MKKSNKNEELQSRREFFKSAAKAALPVVGAMALANLPIVSQAATDCANNCGYGCAYYCLGSCKGKCHTTCTGSCYQSCSGSSKR